MDPFGLQGLETLSDPGTRRTLARRYETYLREQLLEQSTAEPARSPATHNDRLREEAWRRGAATAAKAAAARRRQEATAERARASENESRRRRRRSRPPSPERTAAPLLHFRESVDRRQPEEADQNSLPSADEEPHEDPQVDSSDENRPKRKYRPRKLPGSQARKLRKLPIAGQPNARKPFRSSA